MMLRARMPQVLAQLRATMVTDDPNPWLLVAAAILVVVLLLMLLWPRFRSSSSGDERAATALADPSLAQQRSVERDMHTLLRELSEMSRKISAQLDAKSARLEALIRAADERAARLESLARNSALSPDEPAEAENGDRRGPDPMPVPPDIVIPPPASAFAQDADPRHAQIYALADQGFSPVQIAERLGFNEGEIELIIALRSPRGRAGAAT
jgi:hypothetical protein